MNSSETFVLTQVNASGRPRHKSTQRASTQMQEIKLPRFKQLTGQTRIANKMLRSRSSSHLKYRSITSRYNESGNLKTQQSTQAMTTIRSMRNQVNEKLGTLYQNPSELQQTIRRIESSRLVKSEKLGIYVTSTQNEMTQMKNEYNKFHFLRISKENQLQKYLKELKIYEGITEPDYGEAKIPQIEQEILKVKENINIEKNYTHTLNYMKSNRHKNLVSILEPLQNARRDIIQEVNSSQDPLSFLIRNKNQTNNVKHQLNGVKQSMRDEKIQRNRDQEKQMQIFFQKSILTEFVKKQKSVKETQQQIDSNENKLSTLNQKLKKVQEDEEIEKELEACKNYINRQDKIFFKLKQSTNVTSIEDMVSHYNYLKETNATLTETQEQLENQIDEARGDLFKLQRYANVIRLKHSHNHLVVDSETKAVVQSQIEHMDQIERKTGIIQEKYFKQKAIIAKICGIISRLTFQVQEDFRMTDLTEQTVSDGLKEFSEKIDMIFGVVRANTNK